MSQGTLSPEAKPWSPWICATNRQIVKKVKEGYASHAICTLKFLSRGAVHVCCTWTDQLRAENVSCCRTPLLASILSNIVNFGLDIILMFGFGWGIAGAALATSVAQYISFFILYWQLRRKKMLQARHIRTKPKKDSIQPLLKVWQFRWSLQAKICMYTFCSIQELQKLSRALLN